MYIKFVIIMKNKSLITLTVAVLLSSLCAVRGQSVVSEVHEHKTDTTIVRHWQESIFIVYSHNSDNENWFLLVDTIVPQVWRIVVPPEVTVNDFRIYHDTVVLGGNHVDITGKKRGLLAYFAINDFYSGTGNYYYGVMPQTVMPDISISTNTFNQICDILRLAVYDSSGHTRIAFIGRNYIVGETTYRVGVGSADYSVSPWRIVFIYNKYGIEEYTDIITTKNYVVAVARTNDSARLALRIYPKSDFISKTAFWGGPPVSYYYYNKFGQGLADLEVDENVMATALDDDEFAVAYHYTNSPNEGLAVKAFNIIGGLASLTQGLNVPSIRRPGSRWKMCDVCYSPTLRQISVLNDFDGGMVSGQESIVYQFAMPTLATGLYYGRYLSGYRLQALDSFYQSSNGFIASGYNTMSFFLTLYWHDLLANIDEGCGLHDEILGTAVAARLYETFMQTNINEPSPISGSMPFVVETIERNVICNQ